jgi:hypothetical protein
MDIEKLSLDQLEILSNKVDTKIQKLRHEKRIEDLKKDARLKDFVFIIYDEEIDGGEGIKVGINCNDYERRIMRDDVLYAYVGDGVPEELENLYEDLVWAMRGDETNSCTYEVEEDPTLEKTRQFLLSLGLKEAKPAWQDATCIEERENEMSKYYAKDLK